MDLCHEDKLRLQVLLAQSLHALRINESRMEVHALSEKGEAKVPLHANCKDEKYLRLVRQWLSTYILGSPGGYPVYLRRWTRMGQARDDSLQKLLLLGEPEAVIAVANANGLTNELAKHAWWCAPNADNARRMLENQAVTQGSMGPELAKFLVEFLPFEESSKAIMNSVQLVLKPNLINKDTKLEIWKRGKRRNTYYVGFLQQCPNELPVSAEKHAQYEMCTNLTNHLSSSNSILNKLQLIMSEQGQAVVDTLEIVLRQPKDQDVAVEIFNTLHSYFFVDDAYPAKWRNIDELNSFTHQAAQKPTGDIKALLKLWSEAAPHVYAILFLSMVSETLLDPVFGVTNAIGSVMRKRIAHLVDPILTQLNQLK